MKNIEIKVQIKDSEALLPALRRLGVRKIGVIHQTDTYYNIARGRLKVRETRNENAAVLIYYHRPDSIHSRVSEYQIVRLPPISIRRLKKILARVLGVRTVVRKERTLYIFGQTRIHIDRVVKLGRFLELETNINRRSKTDAKQEYKHVYKTLTLSKYQHIPVSYSDLSVRSNKQLKEVHRAFHARRRKL